LFKYDEYWLPSFTRERFCVEAPLVIVGVALVATLVAIINPDPISLTTIGDVDVIYVGISEIVSVPPVIETALPNTSVADIDDTDETFAVSAAVAVVNKIKV
jgi:hypothetical protein